MNIEKVNVSAILIANLNLIEENFNNALDKSDYVFLSGGGSAFLNDSEDKKIRTPKSNFEYYNAIGFYLYGLTK